MSNNSLPCGLPQKSLERVEACPVCASRHRRLLYDTLQDNVFRCVSGTWSMWQCTVCDTAWLDPRLAPHAIGIAYQAYFTHQSVQKRQEYSQLSSLRKLRRRLVNGYLHYKFGFQEHPRSTIGIFLGITPWGTTLRREFRELPHPRSIAAGSTPRLLDIGCGNGAFLDRARQCGWQVEGIDPDPEAVQRAREKGLQVKCGNIDLYAGQQDLFDYITLNHVIEHVHAPIHLLQRCHDLLKPGGRLWLETPNIDSMLHALFGEHWRGLEPPRHLVLFSISSLNEALRKAGFVNIQRLKYRNKALQMYRESKKIQNEASGMSSEKEISHNIRKIFFVLLSFLNKDREEFISLSAEKRKT